MGYLCVLCDSFLSKEGRARMTDLKFEIQL